MARIVIVQPYLPTYRLPLFEGVVARLRDLGHDCVVVTGSPRGRHAARGDSASAPWLITYRGFSRTIRGHHIRTYESWREWATADLLVLELASGSIDTTLALLFKRRRRIILWGHVGQLTGQATKSAGRLMNWQLRSADAILAYTPSGVERATRGGARRAVSLDNTVDLSGLRAALDALPAADQSDSLREAKRRSFAYIGGLDESKRVDFLASSLDVMWERDPSLRLVVGGQGADEHLLAPAAERGQVRLLGRVGNPEKAEMARTSSLLLCPGRVGLVAVESFTLGLPVVTTDWPYHAPEAEYLDLGVDSLSTPDDPVQYAETVIELANDPARMAKMARAALSKSGWPSMDHMIQTFVDECLRQLESPVGKGPNPSEAS